MYRPKIIKRRGIRTFWNQSDEVAIGIRVLSFCPKDLLNKIGNLVAYYLPTMLIEYSLESVGPQGFERGHALHRGPNFLRGGIAVGAMFSSI